MYIHILVPQPQHELCVIIYLCVRLTVHNHNTIFYVRVLNRQVILRITQVYVCIGDFKLSTTCVCISSQRVRQTIHKKRFRYFTTCVCIHIFVYVIDSTHENFHQFQSQTFRRLAEEKAFFAFKARSISTALFK